MEFDHIGVAVEDAAAFASLYGDVFGLEVVHEESFGGMNVVFLDVGGTDVEALEPVESDTAVGKFLAANGQGMHHVAFAVDDIEAALADAREAGAELIDDEPRPGAWGHTVAFLHPKSTGGVLVEFVEH
ncbi:MAG: methylmalonyl-CoA epimerase [Halanaeroarchaeum sp.]